MSPAQYRDALTRLNLTQVAAARLLGINDRTSPGRGPISGTTSRTASRTTGRRTDPMRSMDTG
jgi:hypothetical protein